MISGGSIPIATAMAGCGHSRAKEEDIFMKRSMQQLEGSHPSAWSNFEKKKGI
jgi:hypothetical protein